jgi:hypothetical protein
MKRPWGLLYYVCWLKKGPDLTGVFSIHVDIYN